MKEALELPAIGSYRPVTLTEEHLNALHDIVADWIHEGFTTPPYEDVEYDLFEWLGLKSRFYDIERPAASPQPS